MSDWTRQVHHVAHVRQDKTNISRCPCETGQDKYTTLPMSWACLAWAAVFCPHRQDRRTEQDKYITMPAFLVWAVFGPHRIKRVHHHAHTDRTKQDKYITMPAFLVWAVFGPHRIKRVHHHAHTDRTKPVSYTHLTLPTKIGV